MSVAVNLLREQQCEGCNGGAGGVWAVADAHVDVLWRMATEGVGFHSTNLQAGLPRLLQGGVRTQVFALFVLPDAPASEQLRGVLRQVDIFYSEVCAADNVMPVRSRREWMMARERTAVAALLSLEGGGCLGGDVRLLRVLHQLGVRGMGLTWNSANELADGCLEPRGAGLTEAGKRVIREMERLGMWVDIAHLGDAGMWDVLRNTQGPLMASHANARAVHDHPRNLRDEVIREIVRRDGWIGVTFEASFLADPAIACVDHVFRHIDHMLELGAENALGIGSDFDGTSHPLPGLASADDYTSFASMLADRYGARTARKLLHENLERFLWGELPEA